MNINLVYGVGVNDSHDPTVLIVDGKRSACPFYRKWTNMLYRCYSKEFHAKQPTYASCSVDPEWHSFMAFKSWMMAQDWEGKHLDKDIIIEGNKIYSPKTCVFVDQKTNQILTYSATSKRGFPLGVSRKRDGYQARCRKGRQNKYLGSFDSVEKASTAYKEYKAELIMEVALRQTNPRVQDALFLRSLSMAYQA